MIRKRQRGSRRVQRRGRGVFYLFLLLNEISEFMEGNYSKSI